MAELSKDVNTGEDQEPDFVIGAGGDARNQRAFLRAEDLTWERVKLLLVDVDGTLIKSKDGHFIALDGDDVEILPGVVDKLREYHEADYTIVGFSNQGGVAFGYTTVEEVSGKMTALQDQLLTEDGVPLIMEIACSFTHPSGTVKPHDRASLSRKPHYGMLVSYEIAMWKRGKIVDWANSVGVGDRQEDLDMYRAAGVRSLHHAWKFFGWDKPLPANGAPMPQPEKLSARIVGLIDLLNLGYNVTEVRDSDTWFHLGVVDGDRVVAEIYEDVIFYENEWRTGYVVAVDSVTTTQTPFVDEAVRSLVLAAAGHYLDNAGG